MGKTAKKAQKDERPTSSGLVDFDTFVSQYGADDLRTSVKVEEIHKFSYDDSSIVDFDSYVDGYGHPESVEDKKSKFVSFVSDLLGIPDDEATAMFDASLKGHFKRAAQIASLPDTSTLPVNRLRLPEGEPEKYLGKGKSGEIYEFLQRVYAARADATAEPLTVDYLKEHDPKALRAFYNRQRAQPELPDDLLALTKRLGGSQTDILREYNVDFSTKEGANRARRLASAIMHHLYD